MDAKRFEEFIDNNMAAMPAERKILRKLVQALKAAGKPVVTVYDGEEYTPVTTLRSIQEQVFNLDESWLLTEDASWVRLTMGNGWDALTDYTTDIEDELRPVNDYISRKLDEED